MLVVGKISKQNSIKLILEETSPNPNLIPFLFSNPNPNPNPLEKQTRMVGKIKKQNSIKIILEETKELNSAAQLKQLQGVLNISYR
jgi:hypothetical protein